MIGSVGTVLVIFGAFGVALIATDVVMRFLARRDLEQLAGTAGPKKATDPWEEPVVGGGIYDHELRGDFRD